MTIPLPIISVSDRERTIIYQTCTRELITVIHQQKERVSPSTTSPFNDLASRKNDGNQNAKWTTKSHILLPNYPLDHIDLIRQNRKRIYESYTIHESYPLLEETEKNDTTSFEQSSRKNLFAYDCESMPLYENQEGCIRDYAEREAYWDKSKAMSPKLFVMGAVSTPQQSISCLGARISSTQSAETIDLVTPDLTRGDPPTSACLRQKRENYKCESSNNLNKKNFPLFQILFQFFTVSFLIDLIFKLIQHDRVFFLYLSFI